MSWLVTVRHTTQKVQREEPKQLLDVTTALFYGNYLAGNDFDTLWMFLLCKDAPYEAF